MEILEYIDSYFNKTLSAEERTAFEKRCEVDKDFAEQVAFYITARQSLKEKLLNQKQIEWQTKKDEEDLPFLPSFKKSFASRWITYAAAACFVLAASVYLFEANSAHKRLAKNYISDKYETLSQTMDASHDSIQLAIAAYNNKDYSKALDVFRSVETNDPLNSEVKKYTGLTYLQQENYDSAVMQFDMLANMKGLHSNAGDILKAISLMERSKPGDKEVAKKLLQKVIDEKEDGDKEAADLLKKI